MDSYKHNIILDAEEEEIVDVKQAVLHMVVISYDSSHSLSKIKRKISDNFNA